jgi:hypothetical protein
MEVPCFFILNMLFICHKTFYSDVIWIYCDFWQATSAGSKDQEAINFLEKKMKNDPAFSYEETVQVEEREKEISAWLFVVL